MIFRKPLLFKVRDWGKKCPFKGVEDPAFILKAAVVIQTVGSMQALL